MSAIAEESFFNIVGKPTILHDPLALLDYGWDWSSWLSASTIPDTIVQQNVTVPADLTLDSAAITADNLGVVAWISGGVAGRIYPVTCLIHTAQGRVDERTIYLQVAKR
jgi:hypothetical protein